VLQTGATTVGTLRRLRDHGVAIALDDFGTGYSSLASLQKLPFTRIKLDRSLIESIDTSPRAASIARAIIGLCRGLELEITAEGIERPEQIELLLGYGPLHVQGYLLAKPVSKYDLLATIASIPGRMDAAVLAARGDNGGNRRNGNRSGAERLVLLHSVTKTR
jgi:EAL domain-containing protein (putative c-di-GMP-specific phosphodiesterase class I)